VIHNCYNIKKRKKDVRCTLLGSIQLWYNCTCQPLLNTTSQWKSATTELLLYLLSNQSFWCYFSKGKVILLLVTSSESLKSKTGITVYQMKYLEALREKHQLTFQSHYSQFISIFMGCYGNKYYSFLIPQYLYKTFEFHSTLQFFWNLLWSLQYGNHVPGPNYSRIGVSFKAVFLLNLALQQNKVTYN
jgi:hypothetical protein